MVVDAFQNRVIIPVVFRPLGLQAPSAISMRPASTMERSKTALNAGAQTTSTAATNINAPPAGAGVISVGIRYLKPGASGCIPGIP